MAFTLDFWVNFSFFIWMLLELLLITLKLPKRGARTDYSNSWAFVAVVMPVSIWLVLWFKIVKIGDYYYGNPTLQYVGLALLWLGIFIREGKGCNWTSNLPPKWPLYRGIGWCKRVSTAISAIHPTSVVYFRHRFGSRLGQLD